jgi:hypothetical protein
MYLGLGVDSWPVGKTINGDPIFRQKYRVGAVSETSGLLVRVKAKGKTRISK